MNAKVKVVKLRNRFDIITLMIRETYEEVIVGFPKDADGNYTTETTMSSVYRVTGSGGYATSHGLMVGDTRTYTFRDREKARAFANGWFESYVKEGFQRIS